MYKVSVPIFVQFLTAQSECIDKTVAHIEAKQLDPNFFLNMRLFPDMYPYARQELSSNLGDGRGQAAAV
jgi:hypothetical protein